MTLIEKTKEVAKLLASLDQEKEDLLEIAFIKGYNFHKASIDPFWHTGEPEDKGLYLCHDCDSEEYEVKHWPGDKVSFEVYDYAWHKIPE